MEKHSACDLSLIEKQLNDDESVNRRFLANPVETLEQLGLKIPDRSKAALVKAISEIKSGPKAVPGSTLVESEELAVGVVIRKKLGVA